MVIDKGEIRHEFQDKFFLFRGTEKVFGREAFLQLTLAAICLESSLAIGDILCVARRVQ
jgi:hypothetical protein